MACMTHTPPVQPSILIAAEDANVFIAFKRNREKFLVMLNAGVFELDSGKAEVNIHNGQIQNIHIHRATYVRARGTM